MNVSYAWLREIAPRIRESADALADRLGMLGAPVEELARPGAELGGLVVARVVDVKPHPNADRLSLCRVEAGEEEPLQVVCGAPNVEAGRLYPLAPVGTKLPGGLEIREATIRGEASQGMLCSEKELGLGRDAGGLMTLADSHSPGQPLTHALGLDDARLTLEITPNRPDLLSHIGVARELAPDGHHGTELPPFPMPESEERTDATVPELDLRRSERQGIVAGVRVELEDADGCPRYIAAVIEGVEVGPSPAWLAARLRSIGQRPINNVVDATNYVLHELGQPLHAFDLDRLAGPAIVVRRAADQETITTLDDQERKLGPEMLVIADAEAPVAVAGVMGGADSEVSGSTTRILLECAFFEPRSVRATARDLGLSTDASYRFERGVDIQAMDGAARRAVELIQAVAGGRVEESGVDLYPEPEEPPVVELRPSRVARVLGVDIPAQECRGLLEHIGFELREEGDDRLAFAVPGFRRHDVTREVDLIEEVARRWGYDRFEDALRPYRPTRVPEAPRSVLEDRVRDFLVGAGLLEARSVSMAPESAGEVPLLRPLSAEEGVLRSTLGHGLLRAAERNLARGVRDIRLFEIGTTFHRPDDSGNGADAPEKGRPREQTRVSALLTGRRRPEHWSGGAPDWDLWDMHGLSSQLAESLEPTLRVEPLGDDDAGDLALPGLYRAGSMLAIREGEALIGVAGEAADRVVDAPAWAAPLFVLELRLTEAMEQPGRPRLQPVPTQPASDRDLALLVPHSVASGTVARVIRESAGELLERLDIFDVYTGEGIPAGTRSIAYRLVFRHADRTLTDAEVDRAVDSVLDRLRSELGVERRG